MTTGSSVLRRIAPIADLATSPSIASMLDSVAATRLPPPLRPRVAGEGTIRIGLMNLRMLVPEELGFEQANESYAAMRDMARVIKSADVDVLFVQELRMRPVDAAQQHGGIGDAASGIAHLIDATDMAITPAISQNPYTSPLQFYGTGAYARNGFKFGEVINERLPTSADDIELRSQGVFEIIAPDERGSFTGVGLHYANEPLTDRALRVLQKHATGSTIERIRSEGRVAYTDAITGQRLASGEFPRNHVFIAGDFNETREFADPVLAKYDLTNALDSLAARGPEAARRARRASTGTAPVVISVDPSLPVGSRHTIDLGYQSGFEVLDAAHARVPRVDSKLRSSDHAFLTFDVRKGTAG